LVIRLGEEGHTSVELRMELFELYLVAEEILPDTL